MAGIRLAAYNGFLFYGTHYDVCVCPIDGNPATDSISLMEQFAEEDADPRIGEKQEIVFNGWRISRVYRFGRKYGYTLWDIHQYSRKGRVHLSAGLR